MSGLEPDPRVVQPTGRTVWVSSTWSGNGSAYHTHRCQAVKSAATARQVDLSVAEWKDYHLCARCERIEGVSDE